MCYLETPNGLKWHYEMQGEGTPVLFLHGWGVNLRIWRQQIKYFSRKFKVLAVDLPGHGRTNWQNIALEEIVEDLVFLLDQLGLPQVGIVGSSLGGLVAFKLFSLAKQKVDFLVLVGSQPKFSRTDDYPYGLEVERFRKLAGQLETSYPSMMNVFFRSLFTKEERASRRYKWIQIFRKTDFTPDKKALLEMLDVLEKEDLRWLLPQIAVPVQFINGTEDYICQKELYEYIQTKIPQARFDWFERCGHFPFLSQPHQFNHVLEEFLTEVQDKGEGND